MRIKLHYLMLPLFALAHIQVQAQEISYGGKAGMNITSISVVYQNSIDTISKPVESGRIMYHAGAVMRLPLNDKFSLQIELLFSVRKNKSLLVDDLDGAEALKQYEDRLPPGVTLQPGQLDFHVDICTTHTMQFIELPIMLNYSPVKYLNLQLGGLFAIAVENRMDVKGSYSYSYPVLGFPITIDQDVDLGLSGFDIDGIVTGHTGADYSRRDIGLMGGLSLELPSGPYLSFRYYRSLTPIETEDKQAAPPNGWGTKTYYNNIQISLGYFFGLSSPK